MRARTSVRLRRLNDLRPHDRNFRIETTSQTCGSRRQRRHGWDSGTLDIHARDFTRQCPSNARFLSRCTFRSDKVARATTDMNVHFVYSHWAEKFSLQGIFFLRKPQGGQQFYCVRAIAFSRQNPHFRHIPSNRNPIGRGTCLVFPRAAAQLDVQRGSTFLVHGRTRHDLRAL